MYISISVTDDVELAGRLLTIGTLRDLDCTVIFAARAQVTCPDSGYTAV